MMGAEERKLLDIYITHWTEPWEVGEAGFRMLCMQRLADWSRIRVTIMHDGGEVFPPECFRGAPFPVRQVVIKHGGIASARNACLDDACAEWIKFCDFDDTFATVYALRDIMEPLERGAAEEYDLLWFDFFAETLDGSRYKWDSRDPVLLHGKLIRTDFAREKGLRFREDLKWCEDSAFLCLLELEIDHKRIGRIITDGGLYVFRERKGSLCNRDEIWLECRENFTRRHAYVEDLMREHGQETGANTMYCRNLCDGAWSAREGRKKGFSEDAVREFERCFWTWYGPRRERLLKCSGRELRDGMEAAKYENSFEMSREEMLSWLRGLRERYETENGKEAG